MAEDTLNLFDEIIISIRTTTYKIQMPKQVLLNICGTNKGMTLTITTRSIYHPLICYDGLL